jgi:ribosome-associated translation inhibitor RaiA
VEVSGNDLIASETDADVYKAIDFLVDKLDRMIRERSRDPPRPAEQCHRHG